MCSGRPDREPAPAQTSNAALRREPCWQNTGSALESRVKRLSRCHSHRPPAGPLPSLFQRLSSMLSAPRPVPLAASPYPSRWRRWAKGSPQAESWAWLVPAEPFPSLGPGRSRWLEWQMERTSLRAQVRGLELSLKPHRRSRPGPELLQGRKPELGLRPAPEPRTAMALSPEGQSWPAHSALPWLAMAAASDATALSRFRLPRGEWRLRRSKPLGGAFLVTSWPSGMGMGADEPCPG